MSERAAQERFGSGELASNRLESAVQGEDGSVFAPGRFVERLDGAPNYVAAGSLQEVKPVLLQETEYIFA